MKRTLLIFTQCYGGDMMDNFSSRPGTTILSATSAGGERSTYEGYDDDAVAALIPELGRTSDDVHAAGVAGKAGSYKQYRAHSLIHLFSQTSIVFHIEPHSEKQRLQAGYEQKHGKQGTGGLYGSHEEPIHNQV